MILWKELERPKDQNNNLKAIITYSKFLGPSISLNQVKKKDQITSFLDSKINGIEEDPDFVDPFLSSNEITYSHYLLFLQIEKRAGINNNITDLLRTCITFLTAYPFWISFAKKVLLSYSKTEGMTFRFECNPMKVKSCIFKWVGRD